MNYNDTTSPMDGKDGPSQPGPGKSPDEGTAPGNVFKWLEMASKELNSKINLSFIDGLWTVRMGGAYYKDPDFRQAINKLVEDLQPFITFKQSINKNNQT